VGHDYALIVNLKSSSLAPVQIIGEIMKKLNQFGYGMVVCLFLAGCSLPASTREHLSVQLYEPTSGLVVTLPSPDIFVHAQATAPDGDVTRMIFYADGLVIGEDNSPVALGGLTSGMMHWFPTEPGEYLVQAEALRSDGSAFTAAARICVLPDAGALGNAYLYQAYGYTGPCELPAPNPAVPPDLEVSMTARAIPGSLAYQFECPIVPANPTIAFEAIVDDPSDRVVFVAVEYSVPSRETAGSVQFETIALNWTSSSSTGEKIFTGTTHDLTPLLQGELQGDGGTLTWIARAISRDGEVLAFDGPNEIVASPCEAAVIGVPMPLVVGSTETFTPVPTETPTLAPYVPPTKKPENGGGSGGSGACSSYSGKDACSAAGCSWDPDKKTCN
jgi:hypothetical protein